MQSDGIAHLHRCDIFLISTSPPIAQLVVSTVSAVGPRKVTGLAYQLFFGLPGAPQFGAGLHVRAGLRSRAKGQLTLTTERVGDTWRVPRKGQQLLRLIQQTVTWRANRSL